MCAPLTRAAVFLVLSGIPVVAGSQPLTSPEKSPRTDIPSEQALVPPRVIRSVSPIYPAHRTASGRHPTVVLELTLDTEGGLERAKVVESVDEDFDRAALEAVRRWSFAPARRGDTPVPSRVHAALHFDLPTFDLTEPFPGVGGGHPHADDPIHDDPDSHVTGAGRTVTETRRYGAQASVRAEWDTQSDRSAADVTVTDRVLMIAPTMDGSELLRHAPGAFVARTEGDAVGQRIMLRGFDAEHGQDLELSVGGLPVNLPSHIHGQGYADLGFVIPEAVTSLRIREGVYDPSQGDFAVAGSVDFRLGVPRDEGTLGLQSRTTYGSFQTLRQLFLFAPPDEDEETFGAVQLRRTDGFGQQRASELVSAMGQYRFGDAGPWRWRLLTLAHGVRADTAGVLRRDDVESGEVGFYDVYPFPTAQRQNALASRLMFGFFGDYDGRSGDQGRLAVWLGYDRFRIQQNYTGFIERSRTLAGVTGRGDLIEQRNQTFSAGLMARYRTVPLVPASFAEGAFELGLSGRFDDISQEQNLLDGAVRNQTWDERVDASIGASDVGFFGDTTWRLWDRVDLRAGFRADVLQYEVEDRLGNFVPAVRPDDAFIQGFRRSASGLAWGPRLSAGVRVFGDRVNPLTVMAAYGEGYRSPQARLLEDGERAPFTKVRSADVGMAYRRGSWLRASCSAFYTRLSDDVVFEAREGRLERVGATRRMGVTGYGELHGGNWLTASGSFTYVDAELLDPPPASAENPVPPFEPGQNLPFVPPLVVRADVGVHGRLHRAFGHDLMGRLGVGVSSLSSRPLPQGDFADPFVVVDAHAQMRWGRVFVALDLRNAFNTEYAAAEFNFVSNWDPSGVPSRTPARHIAAAPPRTLMATLGVRL